MSDRPEAEAFRRNFHRRQLIEIILAELGMRLDANPAAEAIYERVMAGAQDPYAAAAELLTEPARRAGLLRLRR